MTQDCANRMIAAMLPRVRGLAVSHCRRYGLSPTLYADELLSAATYDIARRLHAFDPEKNTFDRWSMWLSGLAMQRWFSNNRRRLGAERSLSYDAPARQAEEPVASPEEVIAAVESLPEQEKEIIRGQFLRGEQVERVRGRCGMAWPTFRARRNSGIVRLRKALATA